MSERENADEGDMQSAILGLRGIFWALNLIVTHHVAAGVVEQEDIQEGVCELIAAAARSPTRSAGGSDLGMVMHTTARFGGPFCFGPQPTAR